MNRKLFFLVPLMGIIFSCMTVKVKDGYSHGTVIFAGHNPQSDILNDRNSLVLVVIPEMPSEKVSSTEFGLMAAEVLKSKNICNFRFVFNDEINNYLKTNTARKNYSVISKEGMQEEIADDLREKISLVAAAGKFKFILFPVINKIEFEDMPVDVKYDSGDSDWPEFYLVEMQKSVKVSISMKVYDCRNTSEENYYSAENEFTSNYDTVKTLEMKEKAVERENRKRDRENDRREEEYEREHKRMEKEADSKFDNVMVALDAIAGYSELKMIRIKDVRISMEIPDENSVKETLLAKAFSDLNERFHSIYDGETVSGNTVNGNGEFRYVNGDSCSGTWIDAKAEGECKFSFFNGALYEGNFSGGVPNGWGIFTSAEGNVYKGTFMNGNLIGEGLWFIKDSSDIYINSMGKIRRYETGPRGFDKDTWKPIKPGNYRAYTENGDIMRVTPIKE